jgi:hypothetical protein
VLQLSEKAITDKTTRCLVIFGGCAGICYSALWYFPILILIGGLTTFMWDLRLQLISLKLRTRWQQRTQSRRNDGMSQSNSPREVVPVPKQHSASGRDVIQRRTTGILASNATIIQNTAGAQGLQPQQTSDPSEESPTTVADTRTYSVPIKTGVAIIAAFLGNAFADLACSNPLTTCSFFHRCHGRTWCCIDAIACVRPVR